MLRPRFNIHCEGGAGFGVEADEEIFEEGFCLEGGRGGVEVPLRLTDFGERTFRSRATEVLERDPAEGPLAKDCGGMPRWDDFDAGGSGEDATAPLADAAEAG